MDATPLEIKYIVLFHIDDYRDQCHLKVVCKNWQQLLPDRKVAKHIRNVESDTTEVVIRKTESKDVITALNNSHCLKRLVLKHSTLHFKKWDSDCRWGHLSISSLQYLDLSHSDCRDCCLARILRQCRDLRSISISNCCHICCPGMLLKAFPQPRLHTLDISFTYVSNLNKLKHTPSLTALNITGLKFLRDLSFLQYVPQLTHLISDKPVVLPHK